MPAGSHLPCVWALTMAVACSGAVAAEERPKTIGRVEVLLTTAPTLSASARASMIAEVNAIWQQQRVAIEWLAPTVVRPVASDRLRVLVVQRSLIVENATDPMAVGELVRPSIGHPLALISIENARHLVSSVRGRAGYELIAVDQRRLGIVLGRALAHEIGHYLLGTHTHAQSGLMRPTFNALEFTDLRDGTFALDNAAATWLRSRGDEKFAYSRR